jgi:hypothetical protein
MPRPKLTRPQIGELANWVAAYVEEQRAAFQAKARPIGPEHRKLLQGFFPLDILDSARVVRGRASVPSFYSRLRAMGIPNAPPFSEMAGITFRDVVVHAELLTPSLLFHELVHAVQYKHLGLQGFAERYVRGFLTGGSYEEIPLEKQAYELEARFSADRAALFSVEAEVQQRIRLNEI